MSKKILIVDDAFFMRLMIKNMLNNSEYTVAGEAENGLQGIEKYKELKPDAVLMDIIMPGMDGIEAVKEIIKIDPAAAIVMCSVNGQQIAVMEALQAGARDFLTKPFEREDLIQTLNKVLYNKH